MSQHTTISAWLLAIFVSSTLFGTSIAFAEEGDEDLAKAKELYANAKSADDMDQVASLCESAIEKGLSDQAKKEANKIWAEVLYQQATELKLTAKTTRDLDRIAVLCKNAIEKGLDMETESVAKGMWSTSLYQYSQQLASRIFSTKPDPRWRFFRTEALTRLNDAIEVDPQFAEAHLLAARLQTLPDGDREKAKQHAENAIEFAGDNSQTKAQAYLELAKLSESSDSRNKLLEQALEADPKNQMALLAKAERLMQEDKIDEAIEELKKLVEIENSNMVAQAYLIRAYIAKEQFQDALKQSDEALKVEPESSVIYGLRGQTYALMEDTKASLEQLDKALKFQPDNVEALLLRAGIHLENEDYDLALADVNQTLRIAPLKRAYLIRSYILAGKEDYAGAIGDILLLVEDDPGNIDFQLQLGYLCNASDRPRKAVQLFSEILKKDEKNLQALRGRGDAYLSYGKHAEAIEDYKAALEIDPENSGVMNNYAWVLATSTNDEVRDGQKALELAEKACKLTENKQAHILSTLASCYAEIGDFENARKWAEKAVETSEDAEQKKGLTEELESYKQNKPWRESEDTKEAKWPPEFEDDADEDVDTKK
jgi:tetratricopeptide (TPR) repeat protein